jgi:hypothetical protein
MRDFTLKIFEDSLTFAITFQHIKINIFIHIYDSPEYEILY